MNLKSKEYWKAVFSLYVMLLMTLILFFVCMCAVRMREVQIINKLMIAGGVLAGGILVSFIANSVNKRLGATTIWYLLAVIGNAMTISGAVAIVSPAISFIAHLFVGCKGFWMCLFAWFCLSAMIGGCIGLLTGMVKAAFASLCDFDLVAVAICLMIAIAGLYGVIPCVTVAIEISPIVGVGCFIAIFGGGALGVVSNTPNADSVFYDSNGNTHYIIARTGPDRVVCTDGVTWHRRDSKSYEQL